MIPIRCFAQKSLGAEFMVKAIGSTGCGEKVKGVLGCEGNAN